MQDDFHSARFAYRITDTERGVLVQDCEDDGEDAAGGRMLHLLQVLNVMDVVVVVSRWQVVVVTPTCPGGTGASTLGQTGSSTSITQHDRWAGLDGCETDCSVLGVGCSWND